MKNKEQGTLNEEAQKLEGFLKGKKVLKIIRHREKEVLIEFEDGTRFYVDWQNEGLEFSITEK